MLEMLRARGLDAGPTQRPLAAGCIAGVLADAPALLNPFTTRSGASRAFVGWGVRHEEGAAPAAAGRRRSPAGSASKAGSTRCSFS